jgi:predicted metal-dependent enzyme (double-stranded beta helix superfamily)
MFDRDRFIAGCRDAVTKERAETVVRDLVARVVSDPSAVEASLGPPRAGGLFSLYRSPELTILNVVWTPGMAICPHEHRMWTVIGLYGGREDNTFYRRGEHGLVADGGKQLECADTALLGEKIIHAVANPLRAFTAAIHVYGGDFFGTPRSEWTADTFVERPFDPERARQVFAEANARWAREALGHGGDHAGPLREHIRGVSSGARDDRQRPGAQGVDPPAAGDAADVPPGH